MSKQIEFFSENDLWESKRWLFTALIITFLLGMAVVRIVVFFEQFFFESEGPLLAILLAAAFILFLFKSFYVFQRHFMISDSRSATHFVWFSDLFFVALVLILFLAAAISPLMDSISDPEFREHIFPSLIIAIYATLSLWSIYRWIFYQNHPKTFHPIAPIFVIHFITAILAVVALIVLSGNNNSIGLAVSAIMLVSTFLELLVISLSNRSSRESPEKSVEP